jgi:hypothetical protein
MIDKKIQLQYEKCFNCLQKKKGNNRSPSLSLKAALAAAELVGLMNHIDRTDAGFEQCTDTGFQHGIVFHDLNKSRRIRVVQLYHLPAIAGFDKDLISECAERI